MRVLLFACAIFCAGLCGCNLEQRWNDAQRDGTRTVNLLPTPREEKAGY